VLGKFSFLSSEKKYINYLEKSVQQIYFIFKYNCIILLPAFFETPLEEFELQLMDAEERLSPDSMESPEPCNITVRRSKRRHVTFEDQVEFPENQIKETVDIGSQTDALAINL
jgi:hypothetical protein